MDTISEAGKYLTISSPQDKIMSGSISPSHNVKANFKQQYDFTELRWNCEGPCHQLSPASAGWLWHTTRCGPHEQKQFAWSLVAFKIIGLCSDKEFWESWSYGNVFQTGCA